MKGAETQDRAALERSGIHKAGGRLTRFSRFPIAPTSAKMHRAHVSGSWDDSIPMCLRTDDDLALKMLFAFSKRLPRGSLSKWVGEDFPWPLVLTVGRFSQPPYERWIIHTPANRERGGYIR